MHIRLQDNEGNLQSNDPQRAIREGGYDPRFETIIDDVADVHCITRPTTLELLEVIGRHEPMSIRETARRVGRDVHQVHSNLEELETLGLIEFEREGRSKRPSIWYDKIEFDLPLKGQNQPATQV